MIDSGCTLVSVEKPIVSEHLIPKVKRLCWCGADRQPEQLWRLEALLMRSDLSRCPASHPPRDLPGAKRHAGLHAQG